MISNRQEEVPACSAGLFLLCLQLLIAHALPATTQRDRRRAASFGDVMQTLVGQVSCAREYYVASSMQH